MQTLGEYLKKGREARNISLSDISDYTKISKIYLDGLENDDYTNMPAELYVKGYISSYASCIGIDEHEALKLYDSFHTEAGACSSIDNRIPQGFGDYFEWSTDRIFVWTRINCERPPSSIRHIYYFKGETVNDIVLTVRSSHWRTWSYKTLSNKYYIGPWRVDITSVDGNLLQSVYFEIN